MTRMLNPEEVARLCLHGLHWAVRRFNQTLSRLSRCRPMDKAQLDRKLLDLRQQYFDAVVLDIKAQQFFRLAPSSSRIDFAYETGGSFALPEEPGLYLCYGLEATTPEADTPEANAPEADTPEANAPYYVGSGGNLRQRLKYHAGNGASSDGFSTLKKKTTAHFDLAEPASSAFLAEHVQFKVVTIPLGRLEVEFFLHERWGINTKARRVRD